MNAYTVYINSTGEIIATGICQNLSDIDYLLNENTSVINLLSTANQYVDNCQIVDMPQKPFGKYKFNYQTKSWEIDIQAITFDALQKRQMLLVESDWTQLPDVNVDKTAWAAYRQHLRDVPQQPGFPITIDWGVPPSEV